MMPSPKKSCDLGTIFIFFFGSIYGGSVMILTKFEVNWTSTSQEN